MIINTTSHDSYDASYFDMRMINHVITVKTGEIHRLLEAKSKIVASKANLSLLRTDMMLHNTG